MAKTPAPGVGPSLHLLGQPVPLVVFERNGRALMEWTWRCRYVDGLNGQHSAWHARVDDVGWAPSYAEAFDAGLRHVALHIALGRTPNRLERFLIWRRSLRRLRGVTRRLNT